MALFLPTSHDPLLRQKVQNSRLGAILIIDYTARVLAFRADRQRALLDKVRSQESQWWRWMITPLCVGVIVSAQASLWPLRVRFGLSLPALDSAVQKRNLSYGGRQRWHAGHWI